MDVLCSRCSTTVVATIPDEASPPADGLGICGLCAPVVNAERVQAATAATAAQNTKLAALAELLGHSMLALPLEPEARLQGLKGMLGIQ